MRTLTRAALTDAATVALAFTASPALAAPPDEPGNGQGATVDRYAECFEGACLETQSVTSTDGDRVVQNRKGSTEFEEPVGSNDIVSNKGRDHIVQTGNVSQQSSSAQYTTADGTTCRYGYSSTQANGETRQSRVNEPTCM